MSRSPLDKKRIDDYGSADGRATAKPNGQASEPVARTGAQAPLREAPINNLIILDGAEQIGHGRQDRVDTAVKGRAQVRSVINACMPGGEGSVVGHDRSKSQ